MARPQHMALALRVLAVVPIVGGLATVVFGSEIVRGHGASDAGVESELRFYATFYAGFGAYLWWIASAIAERGRELRAAAALLFCGGLARAVGVAVDGVPEADYLVLMGIELTLPWILVLWHSRLDPG